MAEISAIDFFDPRGRVNRKGLIVLSGVLLGAQFGVYGSEYLGGEVISPGAGFAINAVLLWLGIAAISKRLHDLDAGASRLIWAALFLVLGAVAASIGAIYTLGEEAMQAGHIGYLIVALVVFGTVIGGTMWLHCAAGVDGANRFGPAPGSSGFARPHPRSAKTVRTSNGGAVAFN